MFLNPKKIIPHLHIVPHMEVALFEVRNHFFALPILSLLQKTGKMYCVGSNENLLQKVFNEIKHIGGSLHVLKGHIEKKKGVPLKDGSLDLVILDNVFFSLENHKESVSEIERLLKRGGRVLVIDWLGTFGGIGPHHTHHIPKAKVSEYFSEIGSRLFNEIDAGDFHFALLFRKE